MNTVWNMFRWQYPLMKNKPRLEAVAKRVGWGVSFTQMLHIPARSTSSVMDASASLRGHGA